jgi:hypothetical protein
MQTESSNRVTSSRPKDESLEAYKAWISDIASRLTTKKTTITFTEEEWIENWQEFWKKSRSSDQRFL